MASTTQEPGTLVPDDAFARTYSSRTYDDPARAVEDYRQVVAFDEAYPDSGASAIAKMTELPLGRVRPWLDGSRPNCVRGLAVAEDHGWIDVDPESETFRGLNALVTWVYSGGSIAKDTWTPYFTVEGDRDRRLLDRAAELVGVELDFTRSATDTRAQEMRPVEHGSVLGRVLGVLGAPRGSKRDGEDLGLPPYLDGAPDRIDQEFVQVYLHNRALRPGDDPTLHVSDVRSTTILDELAETIERLTGERVERGDSIVIIPPAAARQIAVWNPLLGVE